MKLERIAGLLSVAAVLGACSGGTQGIGLPSPSAVSQSPDTALQRRSANLELRLKVPPRARRARYISASTQSIVVKEGGRKLGTFDTTPTSKGCLQAGGGTTCTFSMGAIPGKNEVIVVDTYDGAGGGGNLVAAGTITQTIVANKANEVHLTLGGVERALTVGLSNSAPEAGTASDITVTVNATDADGNTIVAPGNYAYAISLADSDTSGATSLASHTVTSPSANTVTLTYSGAAGTTATITASAANVTNATATLVSVKPHSSLIGGVYAATPNFGSVPYYQGSAAPSFSVNGGALTNATVVAVDDTGRLIAGDAAGDIDVYPLNADATGAVPVQAISGAGSITALAWDSVNDRIVFASAGSASFGVVNANASGAASSVTTYYASPSYPIATTVSGLAVDPNTGTLYVANSTPVSGGGTGGDCPNGTGGQVCDNILVFKPAGGGSYNFDHVIDMQDDVSCQWWNVGQIAFDPAQQNGDGSLGVLWVADETTSCNRVTGLWSSFSASNEAYYTVEGDGTDVVQPATVAPDGSGGVWMGDQTTTWIEDWTQAYTSPTQGSSYYLSSHNGGVSPTSIAVFSVYAPPAIERIPHQR